MEPQQSTTMHGGGDKHTLNVLFKVQPLNSSHPGCHNLVLGINFLLFVYYEVSYCGDYVNQKKILSSQFCSARIGREWILWSTFLRFLLFSAEVGDGLVVKV